MERKVWLITGASSGFGLSTVKELLRRGHQLTGTSRSKARLLEKVGPHNEAQFLAIELDLKSDAAIKKAVDDTIAKFGQLDVVMNNAAYGQRGTVEELTPEQVREEMEINFFPVHSFYRHVLPHFRARRNGYFLSISSTVAFIPSMGLGIYAASKAALTAMTEALCDEVAPLGIKVTSVEPGPFNTAFNAQAKWHDKKYPEDYKIVHDKLDGMHDEKVRRAGDPDKAALLFLKLAEHPNPPKRIFLGKNAYAMATEKCKFMEKVIADWKDLGIATDYEDS
jgi:NAD(P)-dependent dehydrogenase (short-subunit alcohol dehydrogenase family)